MAKETEVEKSLRILCEPVNAGEYEAKQYLRSKGWEVWDVSDNPKYWKQDIDLLLGEDIDNPDTSIEVKWDRRINKTGNMFIEYYNTGSKGKLGWYRFSKAEFLFYGDAAAKTFYIFRFKDLEEYVEAHKEELVIKSCYVNAYYQEGTSLGYLVPIEDFINKYPVQIVNNI